MSLEETQSRISTALAAADRPDGDAKLVAVSKVQPLDRIKAVLDQGHRLFGENRVQEAAGRWPDLREAYDGIDVHLLGPFADQQGQSGL